MQIDWVKLVNWIVEAFINFVFGGLGALVAFRLALKRDLSKEQSYQDKRLRSVLQGGDIPFADADAAARNSRRPVTWLERDIHGLSDIAEVDEADRSSIAILWVKDGPWRGRILKFGDRVIVGRNEGDLLLDDLKVSSPHAQFRCEDDSVFVMDLGSQFGTYVNDDRIESVKVIQENDEIRIGDTTFILKTLRFPEDTDINQR